MDQAILDFATELDHAGSGRDVWGSWHRLMQRYGFTSNFVGQVRRDPRTQRLAMGEVLNNWSEEETGAYLASAAVEVDPMVGHCMRHSHALCHHIDAFRHVPMPARIRHLFEMNATQDYPAKIAVPIHGENDGVWIFNAAGQHRPKEPQEVTAENAGVLRLVAYAAESRMRAVSARSAAPQHLTGREQECLLWLARGLRNDRIAARMGISNATVEVHLANARKKLRALTREQALAEALIRGMITP